MTVTWVVLAAGTAVVDWWAVASDRRRVEAVAKPLVMVFLIGVALTIDADPASTRVWFVGALGAGLIGDVLLLPALDRFLAGLGAFLVGHLLYLGGMAQINSERGALVVGLGVGVVLIAAAGRPIVAAVRSSPMAIPVTVYIFCVAGVVVLGIGTGRWLIGFGAVAFAVSDAMLGSDRFVMPRPEGRVWVHRLYHLGQAGLILGLDPA